MLESHRASDLRLALFSGNYNYVRDGANQALNRLVDFLLRAGAAVEVFSPVAGKPAFDPAGNLNGVPSVAIPGRSEYRLALGLDARSRRKLDAFRPNVIHLSAPDLLNRAALGYARTAGIPTVASVHTRFETYPRYYGLSWLEKPLSRYLARFYGGCDAVYAPSDSVAEELRALGIADSTGSWSRGVDCDRFNPARRDMAWRRTLGIADHEVVILFTSRLVLEKGIDMLVKTLRGLETRQPHRVLVVGEGPAAPGFKANLPQALFLGHLDGLALARSYASADLFIFPSTTETFGNVTLEAMASGLPVVAADATGSRDLVRPGETGTLCEPGCVDEFRRAVSRLVDAPELRAVYSHAARVRAEGFAWKQVLETMLSGYRELLAGKRAELHARRRVLLGKAA